MQIYADVLYGKDGQMIFSQPLLYARSLIKRQTCVEGAIVVIIKFPRETSTVKSITPIPNFLVYDRIPNLMP